MVSAALGKIRAFVVSKFQLEVADGGRSSVSAALGKIRAFVVVAEAGRDFGAITAAASVAEVAGEG